MKGFATSRKNIPVSKKGQVPSRGQYAGGHRLALSIFSVVALLFWLPVAAHMDYWGSDMWHRAFMLAGAARKTILQYWQIPYWNPYMSGGAPLLANPASSFLSPTFILVLVAGVVTGLKLRILLALWIGLCGGYFLGRKIAPGRFAPYLCSFVFMLGSWYPLYMSRWHDEFIPFVYLPWLLLFLCLGAERRRWCAAGGLTLALMFFEGGVYPVPYAVLFIVFYAILQSIRERNRRFLTSLLRVLILGLLVSGIKLLPAIVLHLKYPRPTFWQEPVLPFAAIPRMLWGGDQLSETNFKGAWLGWWEYGMYVGILPSILAGFGALVLWRRSWTVGLTGLIFGSLIFGDYGIFSAWHWIHKLPVFSSLHDPVRFHIVVVFCISILAAEAISYIEQKRAGPGPRIVNAVLLLFVVWTAVDFWQVCGPLYARISSTPPLTPNRTGTFRQAKLPKADQQGPLSYLLFLQNEGLVNNYEPLELPSVTVKAFDEPGYMGEAWLEGSEGEFMLRQWTPNRLCFRVKVGDGATVLVNQRYDEGWRLLNGQEVISVHGILGVPISPPGRTLCMAYLPPLFYPGCILSIIGAFYATLLWRRR
ncbi:MAG: hypothetical protein NTZ78_14385 [Candidatus Aureabacteria bacterium]|nr:hypothetical protein [Candidatus Auribacterota bacterium]